MLVGDAVLGASVDLADGTPAFPPTYRYVDDYLETVDAARRLGPRPAPHRALPARCAATTPARSWRAARPSCSGLDDLVVAELDGGARRADLRGTARAALNPKAGDWPSDGTEGALAFPVAGHLERLVEHGRVAGVGRTGRSRRLDAAMTGVAWGVDYVADEHANAALRDSPRPGPPAVHVDTPALAERVADALLSLPFKTWDFGDSVAFEALLCASERLGDDRWERFAHGWGQGMGDPVPSVRAAGLHRSRACAHAPRRAPRRRLLLWTRWSTSPAFLRARPDSRRGLRDVGDARRSSPRTATRRRRRGIGLCSPTRPPVSSSTASTSTRRSSPPSVASPAIDELIADAVTQALGYVRLLQQPDGLFDHFALRGEAETFGPGWGRGQGWAALGLLEVIAELDLLDDAASTTGDCELAASADRLLTRMAELQRPDGHWEVVVDQPGTGDEYSTAAFMAWAMAEAAPDGHRRRRTSRRRLARGSRPRCCGRSTTRRSCARCRLPSTRAPCPRTTRRCRGVRRTVGAGSGAAGPAVGRGGVVSRVVLITGAGHGIGAATARGVRRGRRRRRRDRRRRDRRARHRRRAARRRAHARPAIGSTSRPTRSWTRLSAELRAAGRPPAVVVNNAFRNTVAPAHQLEPDDWHSILDVTLSGVYRSIRTFHDTLTEARGSVVNVSSVHALLAWPGHPAYAAAKGGMVALTRQLSLDYAPHVRVNAVLPGSILTRVWEGVDAPTAVRPLRVRPRSAASAGPTRSPRSSCSSPARAPPTSPGVALPVDGGHDDDGGDVSRLVLTVGEALAVFLARGRRVARRRRRSSIASSPGAEVNVAVGLTQEGHRARIVTPRRRRRARRCRGPAARRTGASTRA